MARRRPTWSIIGPRFSRADRFSSDREDDHAHARHTIPTARLAHRTSCTSGDRRNLAGTARRNGAMTFDEYRLCERPRYVALVDAMKHVLASAVHAHAMA